ncbi:ABC transporter permease [Vibrio mediterranei]
MNRLKNILNYRGFIVASVEKEFRGKYSASSLGFLWNIINPLVMIFIYTVIFSNMLSARMGQEGTPVSKYEYGIYICSGLIYWLLFTDTLNRQTNLFIDNANYLKKITFPKICILISSMLCSIIYFLINITILITVLLLVDFDFTWHLIQLFPLAILTLLLGSSLGIVLGVINVFIRDVGPFIKSIIQLWFWATPIVYPLSIVPQYLRPYYDLNPMVSIVENVHRSVLHKSYVLLNEVAITTTLITFLVIIGVHLYKRNAKELMDEL